LQPWYQKCNLQTDGYSLIVNQKQIFLLCASLLFASRL
jgi:hypothetical protein